MALQYDCGYGGGCGEPVVHWSCEEDSYTEWDQSRK